MTVAAVIALCVAVPAGASDHLMTINEILPSGPVGAQFVELVDPAAEPFPFPPYRLIVYSPSGGLLGKVNLPEAELAAMGTSPYLVANAAQGGAPDELLTVALPSAGQVCFTRGPSEQRIHCVSYGCPAFHPFASERGSSAALGYSGPWSLQRQASESYGTGDPTPDLPNGNHPSLPCGQPPFPIRPPTPAVDRTRPATVLSARRRQRLSRLSVTVSVNERALVVASGTVSVGTRRFRLKLVKRVVPAQGRTVLRLRLSRRARSAVRAGLGEGRRARASVKVTATDGSNNTSTERRRFRVIP